MNKTVKKIVGNWLDPYRSTGNIMMLLFGILIITNGDIGLKATPTSEVKWLGVFSTLPSYLGQLLIWFVFDDLFTGGQITKFVVERITLALSPVIKAIIGEEKFAALQKRLEKVTEEKDKKEEEDAQSTKQTDRHHTF